MSGKADSSAGLRPGLPAEARAFHFVTFSSLAAKIQPLSIPNIHIERAVAGCDLEADRKNNSKGNSKGNSKIKGVGQECPTHTCNRNSNSKIKCNVECAGQQIPHRAFGPVRNDRGRGVTEVGSGTA